MMPPLPASGIAQGSSHTVQPTGASTQADLAARYRAVRTQSETLCQPLAVEDYVVQSMPDCSPTKWHLAHTSWFFETFVLKPHQTGYQPYDPQYERLFNSYYNTVGPQHCRPKRGLLSRPTVQDVFAYRAHVDQHMSKLFARHDFDTVLLSIIEVGLQHEQQHQELILTDIKHVLASNVLRAVYGGRVASASPQHTNSSSTEWLSMDEGMVSIGHESATAGFAYDNESPRHRVFLDAFEIAARLVTCREYLEFMHDGGYERSELWLSDGWRVVSEQQWRAPLYWGQENGAWTLFTLAGQRALNLDEPVCHVSFYEADAYARWAGARLPNEAEWELVARQQPFEGNFLESGCFHPVVTADSKQFFGDVWEWTSSPYSPYPGYKPPTGAMGEYNSKFMCNQMVLRGGSCVTPIRHMRATYRNFFPPEARWQFSGVRLARS